MLRNTYNFRTNKNKNSKLINYAKNRTKTKKKLRRITC